MTTILVTGGAGYIGSHTCVELLENGYKLVVIDNLSNSKDAAIRRVMEITGKKIIFYRGDLLDSNFIDQIFDKHKIEAVIHFAGLKSVFESTLDPLKYYYNNIYSTLNLCDNMQKHKVKKIVFSSSATVYGLSDRVPIKESSKLQPTNPYGQTKLMIETILQSLFQSDRTWSVCILRYFNPVGAHPSGNIGEDPNGLPNNLFPYITQVACGKLDQLRIYGNDYSTIDGTGVRDYIHVCDLANGHKYALELVCSRAGFEAINLGTGKGYSVLEVVEAFKKVVGREIAYSFQARRSGDVAECYASTEYAQERLGWRAKMGIEKMCQDAWNWQQKNPNGYVEE